MAQFRPSLQRLESEPGRPVETLAADLNDKADLARVEAALRTNASMSGRLSAAVPAARYGIGHADQPNG
jgi:uncharacterized protein